MRIILLSLVLALFASGCSPKVGNGAGSRKPRFKILASDLAVPAQVTTNGIGSGHETMVVPLHFSAAKKEAFRKFTQEHKGQQVQLVVRSKIVAQPTILHEITNGQTELVFSSFAEAQDFADSLKR